MKRKLSLAILLFLSIAFCMCGFVACNIEEEPAMIAATEILINESEITLEVGQSETLIATVLPENATDKTVMCSSSNELIARVENGFVEAKSEGSAIISAKAQAGDFVAECLVTVYKLTVCMS